jgi:hypothetical protein
LCGVCDQLVHFHLVPSSNKQQESSQRDSSVNSFESGPRTLFHSTSQAKMYCAKAPPTQKEPKENRALTPQQRCVCMLNILFLAWSSKTSPPPPKIPFEEAFHKLRNIRNSPTEHRRTSTHSPHDVHDSMKERKQRHCTYHTHYYY